MPPAAVVPKGALRARCLDPRHTSEFHVTLAARDGKHAPIKRKTSWILVLVLAEISKCRTPFSSAQASASCVRIMCTRERLGVCGWAVGVPQKQQGALLHTAVVTVRFASISSLLPASTINCAERQRIEWQRVTQRLEPISICTPPELDWKLGCNQVTTRAHDRT